MDQGLAASHFSAGHPLTSIDRAIQLNGESGDGSREAWDELNRATRHCGLLRTQRDDLRAKLAELATRIRMYEAEDFEIEFLAQFDAIDTPVSAPPAGEPFTPDVLSAMLDSSDWVGLLASAERELHALPDSVSASMCRALALIQLGRHAEAAAEAERAATRFPSRHPSVLAAIAYALGGDPVQSLHIAFRALRRRLQLNYPETCHSLVNLPQVDDDLANVLCSLHELAAQRLIQKLVARNTPPARLHLFGGLLTPKLSQMYGWLKFAAAHIDQLTQLEQTAVLVGLARGERWYGDFDAADEWLARLPPDAPEFATDERALVERDRAMITAGEIELVGHTHRFTIFRTTRSRGSVWTEGSSQIHDEDDMSDKTETQIADSFREVASEWIASGFCYKVLRIGPLLKDNDKDNTGVEQPGSPLDVRASHTALTDAE